ncbi:MAG: hypothetical protein ACTSU6_05475 [Candidatus Njordarchaeales archaeon]
MKGKREKKFFYEQKQIDEKSLYYIVERDLDTGAIFRFHDGWYSQVPFGKGKRIDYVVRYGDEIYGIEVKKGFPNKRDFEQAERYLGFLNGIFLAYPADTVGQAVYISELKESSYPDIGLISLALFRSHIIRKAKRKERRYEQIWREWFDEKEYFKGIRSSDQRTQLYRLSETVLDEGCFLVTYNRNYEKVSDFSRLSFNESDWKGLATLYGAHLSTSIDRYFSIKDLYDNYCKDIGWKRFDLTKLELSNLAVYRSYGTIDYMWSLSDASIFFIDKIQNALKKYLGETEWKKLNNKIKEWKLRHKENQTRHKREIIQEHTTK